MHFRLAALPVEAQIFLVRAAGDAHPPAGHLSVDQHDAIFFTLAELAPLQVATHAGLRQCSHRRGRYIMKVFSNWPYIAFCMFQFWSLARFSNSPPRIFFPVGPLVIFCPSAAGNQRARRAMADVCFPRGMQVLVVANQTPVVVADARRCGLAKMAPAAAPGCPCAAVVCR